MTVDGLAGTGKSTLARLLAERLGFAHLNSGLFYRAVASLARDTATPRNAEQEICQLIRSHRIQLSRAADGKTVVELDGRDISSGLLAPEISEAASQIASLAAVRSLLLGPQRESFGGFGVVAEGRDMGTVVFPTAKLKFFITAEDDVRIARRIKQLGLSQGVGLQEDIRREILERDRRDSERSVAPTLAAPDAVKIDNSLEGLTSIVEHMYQTCLSRGIIASAS